jgi:wyosine [tRNA(Phe)-imidazoG37] synthetase (radical SAM superfamily)
MSFLFDEIIFGPVKSRRFGVSLGVNVLPEHKKICTFNCIYCECGWTQAAQVDPSVYHTRSDIHDALEHRLISMKTAGNAPDAITFAGNGEPSLHPEFAGVIDDTLALRDKYFPGSRVVVLSNSTTLADPEIFNALTKVQNIMKLDAGTEATFRLINGPLTGIHLSDIVDDLVRFQGKLTIQTLFLKATIKGQTIDNTTQDELSQWLGHLKRIRPEQVMIYPIDRPAPARNIEKLDPLELQKIAEMVRNAGFNVKVYS